MRLLLGLVLVVVLVLAGACGGASPDAGSGGGADLVGTLGGDAQLEGGCVWLEADGTRFQPQWPAGYSTSFDPLRLTGPDGETVAEEGDEVAVNGRQVDDVVTTCQVGPVFEVTEVVRP